MSLHAAPLAEIPTRTAELVRIILPKGNTITQLRDCFGAVYSDDQFRSLYPTRGQPAYAPWRSALVTIFQFLEHLINGADTFKRCKEEVSCTVKLKRHHRKET